MRSHIYDLQTRLAAIQAAVTKAWHDLDNGFRGSAMDRLRPFATQPEPDAPVRHAYTGGATETFYPLAGAGVEQPEPDADPLVEALNEMGVGAGTLTAEDADRLRADLAARSLEVRKVGEGKA